jgi:acetylornithine deacetylase/succinyl-diaminopimelate desuccinylase-like protein
MVAGFRDSEVRATCERIGGMCCARDGQRAADLYVFHQAFSIPAVLWGPRGGNTHAADEYVEIDSLLDAAKTLLLFVCRWCGASA